MFNNFSGDFDPLKKWRKTVYIDSCLHNNWKKFKWGSLDAYILRQYINDHFNYPSLFENVLKSFNEVQKYPKHFVIIMTYKTF